MTSSPPQPPEPGQQPASTPSYPTYPVGESGTPTYPQGNEPPAAAIAQPQSIRTAVMLMRVGAGLSLLGLVVALVTLGSLKDNIKQTLIDNNTTYTQSDLDTAYNIAIISVVVIGLLGIALWLWMASANGAGKKWARIVATVLGVLNVLLIVVSLAQQQATVESEILSVISALLAIVILVLLWRKESSDFYAARSRPQYR